MIKFRFLIVFAWILRSVTGYGLLNLRKQPPELTINVNGWSTL